MALISADKLNVYDSAAKLLGFIPLSSVLYPTKKLAPALAEIEN